MQKILTFFQPTWSKICLAVGIGLLHYFVASSVAEVFFCSGTGCPEPNVYHYAMVFTIHLSVGVLSMFENLLAEYTSLMSDNTIVPLAFTLMFMMLGLLYYTLAAFFVAVFEAATHKKWFWQKK
jgi:hypothetical protein